MRQGAGRITTAGMTREVVFESVDGEINDRIDEAYRAKYKGSPYLDPMIANRARSDGIPDFYQLPSLQWTRSAFIAARYGRE
jgi:hypothetical protein